MPGNRTQISKWGNSNAVRIPKTVLDQARLREDDEIEVYAENGRIVIEAVVPEVDFAALLDKVTSKNRHGEVDWGGPQGGEVW